MRENFSEKERERERESKMREHFISSSKTFWIHIVINIMFQLNSWLCWSQFSIPHLSLSLSLISLPHLLSHLLSHSLSLSISNISFILFFLFSIHLHLYFPLTYFWTNFRFPDLVLSLSLYWWTHANFLRSHLLFKIQVFEAWSNWWSEDSIESNRPGSNDRGMERLNLCGRGSGTGESDLSLPSSLLSFSLLPSSLLSLSFPSIPLLSFSLTSSFHIYWTNTNDRSQRKRFQVGNRALHLFFLSLLVSPFLVFVLRTEYSELLLLSWACWPRMNEIERERERESYHQHSEKYGRKHFFQVLKTEWGGREERLKERKKGK